MNVWIKKQISCQRGGTAHYTGGRFGRRFYQLGSSKRKRRKSKYIKYQCGGALPLLAMFGKLVGKALLNLVGNKILN